MLSGEIVSPTIILFQYIKSLSNIDKLRAFIAPKMTYVINFSDNNVKSDVYTGWDIHGIYRYLEMVGAPTTFTTSGQRSHHLNSSCYRKNDAATLQPVIKSLRNREISICECCGRIGHKSDACIICGQKFLSPNLSRKMNQFNALHGDEPKETSIEWNSQPPAAHLKSRTSP